MKALFLAAGFSTRLYPLTKNFPKGLLEINHRPIISQLLDQVTALNQSGLIDEIALITNQISLPHYQHFMEKNNLNCQVLSNGISLDDQRLGAIGDLALALQNLNWHDDILVLPSDTLVSILLTDLLTFFQQRQHFTNVVTQVKDLELIRAKLGNVLVHNNQITTFTEKPAQPISNLVSVPIYIYPAASLPLIEQYLKTGQSADSPGAIIPWLLDQIPCDAFVMKDGYYFDIGTMEMYQQLKQSPVLQY